ncbi:Bbp19 family protein [Orrella dioscoreae]|uniref:Bbp19-like phage domain-containing protein n=1 Tax=Orrella dioscoreae TaxID=1851544 RepID=A0A1C3K1R6_9BURK|nr:hypothetical protein [Orrella dioscoreae]SBT25327.1 hypothetical protein ODI_03630 [Orrella dioscoreae]SOE49116.1 hypothetical protein ODI_R1853 [Orrella dioscoreae]
MNIRQKFQMMLRRRASYRSAFLDPAGQPTQAGAAILADLARFCRAYESTTVVSPVTRTVDTHASMQAEGRREVFNRLTYYLNLTEAQIYQMMERENARNSE